MIGPFCVTSDAWAMYFSIGFGLAIPAFFFSLVFPPAPISCEYMTFFPLS